MDSDFPILEFDGEREALIEPSKVIADSYQNVSVRTKDGDVFTGRMVRDTAAQVVIETEPLTGTREAIQRERGNEPLPANPTSEAG